MSQSPGTTSRRRWMILALIGVAQLMVVLDATIANIALPSAHEALGFTDESRQWVITAYALSFGSLLLLGGYLESVIARPVPRSSPRACRTTISSFAGISPISTRGMVFL